MFSSDCVPNAFSVAAALERLAGCGAQTRVSTIRNGGCIWKGSREGEEIRFPKR
jgi:hypothetical protein